MALPAWELSGDGKALTRHFVAKNFDAGLWVLVWGGGCVGPQQSLWPRFLMQVRAWWGGLWVGGWDGVGWGTPPLCGQELPCKACLLLPAHAVHAAVRFFGRVAEVANVEGHHPDLHLTNYREVRCVSPAFLGCTALPLLFLNVAPPRPAPNKLPGSQVAFFPLSRLS